MSIRAGSSQLSRHLSKLRLAEIPEFLCPILRSTPAGALQPQRKHSRHCFVLNASITQRRFSHTASDDIEVAPSLQLSPQKPRRKLPPQCVGCGALSQTYAQDEPGFYTLARRAVRDYTRGEAGQGNLQEQKLIEASLNNVDSELLKNLGLDTIKSPEPKQQEPPVCDRCHKLRHHDSGVSIHHPSIQSLQDTILESPHKYNHIYHVIDSADFPMSLVPNLYQLLNLTPQRTLNRRSKNGKFYHGRKTEVSFIITRADLLAPLKTQVDSLMPYLTSVLRDSLGRAGKDVRLGNVRCVSAVRSWWTKELKEDIWSRGGGGWMVGKVNVGKSQLFNDVFPKGRRSQPVISPWTQSKSEDPTAQESAEVRNAENDTEADFKLFEDQFTDPSALLPPVQAETDYPSMPLVSALPGTTASPIRVPFGNGKGELVDLPGLSRGDLEHHVQEEFRPSLLMRSRVRPEQQTVKPGQSLLLGGLIRITPTSPDAIILAYAFTPIDAHLTATEKAIGTQTQTRESGLTNIALPGVGEKIAKAGTFHLKWDVTRQRTGPITARDAAAIKPERLPYRVLATDILIEGCGWVELVAQVRKGPGEMNKTMDTDRDAEEHAQEEVDPSWPAVEVFSPEGKFIAARRPMNAWSFLSQKPVGSKGRPRQSMKGAKKADKLARK